MPLFVVYGGGILLLIVSAFVPALKPAANFVQGSYFIVLLGYCIVGACAVFIGVPAALLVHWFG